MGSVVLRIVVLLGAVLFSAVNVIAETRTVHSPGDGYLNLRSGPGTTYPVVMAMDHGSKVQLIGQSGAWSQVRHETGLAGWAFGKYLVERDLSMTGEQQTFVGIGVVNSPNDGFLNLRNGAGSDHFVIMRMKHGSTVQIISRSGKWSKLRHETGQVGWAYSKYLSGRSPSNSGNADRRDGASDIYKALIGALAKSLLEKPQPGENATHERMCSFRDYDCEGSCNYPPPCHAPQCLNP
ncbi:SH3 domain-containing protein [Hoeflea sp. G2-23]|uniref:SH3 domain-containing protein n=1 Tax=Hoeflea algicola TaxID=2983763 RepID=A0ABT3ZE31_9HYPH|nr:SH3 domain-containing protein [Hoeflea algicola]MCY0149554.1 SH3 domain-containing protein [Hoeflea algicola]